MRLLNTNKRYSMIDTTADELAAQFTLIDLSIFKAIKRDELLHMSTSRRANNSHNNRHKQTRCPNVVALNKQFNQVTFWVVSQILSHESPRNRAELMSTFVKTAKRLHQLNNLHSSYAVVSALSSSPVYRLERTWYQFKKKYPKERQTLDQLGDFFSENNNYSKLRTHVNNCDLPCIPYLGIYSRDMIYINEAHPEGTIQRVKSTSQILDLIERFQQSEYEQLVVKPEIRDCFLACRYIDELQKFVEDENFRRSYELEPPPDTAPSSDAQNSPTNANPSRQKRSAMLLAGLASMIQSAVFTTTSKPNTNVTMQPQRSWSEVQKSCRYLIDDSFIHSHNINIQDNNNDHDVSDNNLNAADYDPARNIDDHCMILPPISTSN